MELKLWSELGRLGRVRVEKLPWELLGNPGGRKVELVLGGGGLGGGAGTRVLFCWRTERKEEKPGIGGTSKIGMVFGVGLGCHTKVTQRRFLPKVALILPGPSPAGSLAWHLALPAESHGTDLMLCHTRALLLILQRESSPTGAPLDASP